MLIGYITLGDPIQISIYPKILGIFYFCSLSLVNSQLAGLFLILGDKEMVSLSEKLINPDGYLHWSVVQRKACSWGRRLAWFRIHAWGVCDPGFKSQRPHHISSRPYGDVTNHFRLFNLLME